MPWAGTRPSSIVFQDAVLDDAAVIATGLIAMAASEIRFGGQTCVAANRVLVHDSVL